MLMQFMIHLYDGKATVLDGDSPDARYFVNEHGRDWADWPQDLGCYEKADGFLILKVEVDEEGENFSNPEWRQMTEAEFRLTQAYGSPWFE